MNWCVYRRPADDSNLWPLKHSVASYFDTQQLISRHCYQLFYWCLGALLCWLLTSLNCFVLDFCLTPPAIDWILRFLSSWQQSYWWWRRKKIIKKILKKSNLQKASSEEEQFLARVARRILSRINQLLSGEYSPHFLNFFLVFMALIFSFVILSEIELRELRTPFWWVLGTFF